MYSPAVRHMQISGDIFTSTLMTAMKIVEATGDVTFSGGVEAVVFTGAATGLTGVSGITGTGTLASGSIGGSFGAINVGSNSITGGAISGTTATLSGDVTVSGASALAYRLTRSGVTSVWQNGTGQVYIGASSNHPVELIVNNTTVATFGSTGLNNTVIGATTPAAGSFTTLAATGVLTSARATITGSGTGGGTTTATVNINEAGVRQWSLGAGHAVSGELAVINGSTGLSVLDIKTTGLAVTGTLSSTGAISASNFSGSHSGASSGTNTGDNTTATALTTGNNYQMNSLGVNTAASGIAGEIRATGNITAYYSDERLKTRLGLIKNAFAKVCSLDGFYYHGNEIAGKFGYSMTRREVGVSAQQVEAVLREIIAPAPIDPQYMTLDYARLAPLFVEAFKEVKIGMDMRDIVIADLRRRILILEARN